jgi:hypothetical protein
LLLWIAPAPGAPPKSLGFDGAEVLVQFCGMLKGMGLGRQPMHRSEEAQMAEKTSPATVHVYFDNVNSESYQTFLAYCDRLEYKYAVELGKPIDVRRSMKRRIVTGEPTIITDEME